MAGGWPRSSAASALDLHFRQSLNLLPLRSVERHKEQLKLQANDDHQWRPMGLCQLPAPVLDSPLDGAPPFALRFLPNLFGWHPPPPSRSPVALFKSDCPWNGFRRPVGPRWPSVRLIRLRASIPGRIGHAGHGASNQCARSGQRTFNCRSLHRQRAIQSRIGSGTLGGIQSAIRRPDPQ